MNSLIILTSLLLLIQSGDALKCYTCLFPSIAPMDCLKFPVTCPPSERCLTSTATGRRGNFQFVIHERGCSITSLCGTSGQRNTLGINVTFHNTCCDIDLCNSGSIKRGTLGIALAPVLLLLFQS
ncbi:uncharacterized protein WCC33_015300 [Rhinophrynus dorsalis]